MLLVAATRGEIEPLLKSFSTGDRSELLIGDHEVRVLITGVGMTATAYAMGQCLQQYQFDFALNAGIAGCFDPDVPAGDVFSIIHDTFSELGAEDGDRFIELPVTGMGEVSFKASGVDMVERLSDLPIASAITVNTVHGNEASINLIRKRLNPLIESMEGAAFFYACERAGIPCGQIRAVSNLVERRNRDNWNIPLAIANLNSTLIKLLTS